MPGWVRKLALLNAYLEPAGQKLVLHFQVIAFMDLRLEGLIQDHVAWVILNVLPAGIAMPGGTVKGKLATGMRGLGSKDEVGAPWIPACCLCVPRQITASAARQKHAG